MLRTLLILAICVQSSALGQGCTVNTSSKDSACAVFEERDENTLLQQKVRMHKGDGHSSSVALGDVPAPEARVLDTPGWTNGYGYTCKSYSERGWCSNGGFPSGMEWTGKEGTDAAQTYNHPGLNCVVCGKGAAQGTASVSVAGTGSYGISVASDGATVWNDRDYTFLDLSPALQGATHYQGPVRMPSGDVLTLNCGASDGVFYALISQGRGGTFETTLLNDGWTTSAETAKWVELSRANTFDVYAKSGCQTTLPASSGSDVVVTFLHAQAPLRKPVLFNAPESNGRLCGDVDGCALFDRSSCYTASNDIGLTVSHDLRPGNTPACYLGDKVYFNPRATDDSRVQGQTPICDCSYYYACFDNQMSSTNPSYCPQVGANWGGWSEADLRYYCPEGKGSKKIGMRGKIRSPPEGGHMGAFANIYPVAARPSPCTLEDCVWPSICTVPEDCVYIENGARRPGYSKWAPNAFDIVITGRQLHIWQLVPLNTSKSDSLSWFHIDVTWDIGGDCTCGNCED